jgi:peptide/nickel transport system substrate-binding protein
MTQQSYQVTRRAFLRGGAAAAMVIGAGGALNACASGTAATPATSPVKGGTLRAAITTGRGTESLDPQFSTFNFADSARIFNLYDALVRFAADGTPRLQLADELTPDASATTWTLRARQGLTFHDGRPVTADDIIFSIRRAADKRSVLAPSYAFVNTAAIKKADTRTVIIPTLRPVSILPQMLANASFVVPADFDPGKPVGSGPFSVRTFQPGRASLFVRHPDYWDGPAHVDQLVIAGVADPVARVNALKAGQVDLVDAIPAALAPTLTGATRLLRSPSAGYLGFAMNCKTGPFQDERARRALRMIVDRKAMVEQVLSGYGRVGNDIYAPADPAGIDPSIPQWGQDIGQARSLLRAAGQAGLTAQLTAVPTATGAIPMGTVLAQQAKAAGVTIQVRQLDINTYIRGFGTYPLATTSLAQLGSSFIRISLTETITGAPYSDTQFADPAFDHLVSQALAELDPGKRADLIHQAQRILHDSGGYLIWGFPDFLDGGSGKVGGFTANAVLPVGGYNFKALYLGQ